MFLEAVIIELSGQPAIGAGILHRICVAKQRELFDPPNLSRSTGTSNIGDAPAITRGQNIRVGRCTKKNGPRYQGPIRG